MEIKAVLWIDNITASQENKHSKSRRCAPDMALMAGLNVTRVSLTNEVEEKIAITIQNLNKLR